nr:hypothetical protein [Microctonus hyperodae filamentous virus]
METRTKWILVTAVTFGVVFGTMLIVWRDKVFGNSESYKKSMNKPPTTSGGGSSGGSGGSGS